MKKVLIPNGSFHDIPLIIELKRIGYYVIASGDNPEQSGYSYADQYIRGDFSDKDAMLAIAQREHVDQVCSNCNDFGFISSCYVAEKMGFPGHDSYQTALTLQKKDLFKKWAADKGILTPPSESFQHIEPALAALQRTCFPIIVKPSDLGAGQGVQRANSIEEARAAIQDAIGRSRAKTVIIEPFVEGSSHSFNAFVVNQRVVNYYSDNEYMRYDPYRVSTSASPASGAEWTDEVLVRQTEIIAQALELTDGLVHSQYILDRVGCPHILEITRRMSGDWYPEPESKAQDVDWVHWIVRSELGLDCSGMPAYRKSCLCTGRHCLNGPRPGRVVNVRIDERLRRHVYSSAMWLDGGYVIKDTKKDYPGILFFSFEDRKEMLEIVENIDDYIELIYG